MICQRVNVSIRLTHCRGKLRRGRMIYAQETAVKFVLLNHLLVILFAIEGKKPCLV
jgi:hypothetical protein